MFILTVVVPDSRTYDDYDYGYGEVLHIEPCYYFGKDGEIRGKSLKYTVQYEDSYYAEYQAARFASGLYFADVVDTVKDA